MGPPTFLVLSLQPGCMWCERSSHHSKSQGPDVTALKQGHFYSAINHTPDTAKAITACGLILVFFFFFSLSLSSLSQFCFACWISIFLFLSLSLSLSFNSPWNSQPYCSEIRNHITASRGCWGADTGILLPLSSDQYCHLCFLSWPFNLPRARQATVSEREWNPFFFSVLGPDVRCIIKWVTL